MRLIFKLNYGIRLMKASLLIDESEKHQFLCPSHHSGKFLSFSSPMIAKVFFIHIVT